MNIKNNLFKVFLVTMSYLIYAQNDQDSNKTIIIGPNNTEFAISLDSNPSTGYKWLLNSYNDNLINPLETKYTTNQAKETKLGSGGQEIWSFEAIKDSIVVPQVTEISFIYARPWELNINDKNIKIDKKNIKIVLDPDFLLEVKKDESKQEKIK